VKDYIRQIGDEVLEGKVLSLSEAKKLLGTDDLDIVDLIAAAHQIRHRYLGNTVDLCTLLSAKSGRCSEDCKFCAQSAHYHGECETHELLEVEEMVQAAHEVASEGGQRFCIISSGKRLDEKDFERVIEAAKHIRQETQLKLDCSLGLISKEQAKALRDAGVERYNHNLETAPGFFEEICTTHTFTERVETLHFLIENGFSLCSGGIIGMGETPEQWMELVFLLRDLGVDCIPVNVLNPRPGTPLEHMVPPSPLEVLRIIAVMRLAAPTTHIKLAGGRELNLRDFQAAALWAGATGMIIGGYLTTSGRAQEDDYQMLKDLGLRWD
jgi:biotin synthase